MHKLQRQSKIAEIPNQRVKESIADLSLLRSKYFEGDKMTFCDKRGRDVESCISIKFCDSKKCSFKKSRKKKKGADKDESN